MVVGCARVSAFLSSNRDLAEHVSSYTRGANIAFFKLLGGTLAATDALQNCPHWLNSLLATPARFMLITEFDPGKPYDFNLTAIFCCHAHARLRLSSC
jgi:hypothetical protein